VKRVALAVALSLSLVAVAPSQAHTLKASTAKKYAKKEARVYYYPARVYVSIASAGQSTASTVA
jgi:hypothetical protein